MAGLSPAAASAAVPGSRVSAATASTEVYPVPADGVFRLIGAGWGHGRGMSQWGAYQAATEGATFSTILGFYYPGTTLAPGPARRIRVLLTSDRGRDLVVRARPTLAIALGGGGARRLAGKPAGCRKAATSWRARATKSGLRLSAYCGKWRTVRTTSARTVTFSTRDGLVGTRNGSLRRGYRGTVTAVRSGSRSVSVVNTVPLEQYLRTVVPAESSASWPREALRAQAVAARTYAAAEAGARSPGSFDVYDSTRSQVYRAAFAYTRSWRVSARREFAATDAAIADTARLMVTVQGHSRAHPVQLVERRGLRGVTVGPHGRARGSVGRPGHGQPSAFLA